MRTLLMVLHAIVGLLFIWPALAQAEPELSLDEAISLATQSQPLLQSFDEAARASKEAAVASSQLPDPRLRLGILNLPITGSDAARFNRDDMTMSTIGIMQQMVPQEERDAAARTMQAAAGQFQAEKAATARVIKRDVALAWLDVFEAQRRSELYRKMADEMAAERETLVSRISTGSISPAEALKLDSELSMVNDQRLAALREEKKARAALARWIGAASQRPLARFPATNLPATVAEAQALIDQHPALLNAEQMEAVAQSEVELARAQRELDWSWEVMYGKRRSELSDMVGFQVEIELPWDRPNRQDRRIAEKMLLVEKAQQLTADRRKQLLAELQSVMAEAEIAEAREKEHTEKLIPAVRSRLEVLQAGYAAGRDNLSGVWDARRSLIEAELHHWLVLSDRERAAAKLDYLLSGNPADQGVQP